MPAVYNLSFPVAQAQTIFDALLDKPARDVLAVLDNFRHQTMQQDQAEEAAKATVPATVVPAEPDARPTEPEPMPE